MSLVGGRWWPCAAAAWVLGHAGAAGRVLEGHGLPGSARLRARRVRRSASGRHSRCVRVAPVGDGRRLEPSPVKGSPAFAMFGGDARHTGRRGGPAPTSAPKELWSVDVDGVVAGSPTIGPDGTIYVTSHDGRALRDRSDRARSSGRSRPATARGARRRSRRTARSTSAPTTITSTRSTPTARSSGSSGSATAIRRALVPSRRAATSTAARRSAPTARSTSAATASTRCGPTARCAGSSRPPSTSRRRRRSAPTARSTRAARTTRSTRSRPTARRSGRCAPAATSTRRPSIGADGTIYVGSDDHALYAISPQGRGRVARDHRRRHPRRRGARRRRHDLRRQPRQASSTRSHRTARCAGSSPPPTRSQSTPGIATNGTILFGAEDEHRLRGRARRHAPLAHRAPGDVDTTPAIARDGTIVRRRRRRASSRISLMQYRKKSMTTFDRQADSSIACPAWSPRASSSPRSPTSSACASTSTASCARMSSSSSRRASFMCSPAARSRSRRWAAQPIRTPSLYRRRRRAPKPSKTPKPLKAATRATSAPRRSTARCRGSRARRAPWRRPSRAGAPRGIRSGDRRDPHRRSAGTGAARQRPRREAAVGRAAPARCPTAPTSRASTHARDGSTGRITVHPAGYGFVATEDGDRVRAREVSRHVARRRSASRSTRGPACAAPKAASSRCSRAVARGSPASCAASAAPSYLEPDDPRIAADYGRVGIDDAPLRQGRRCRRRRDHALPRCGAQASSPARCSRCSAIPRIRAPRSRRSSRAR